MNNRVAFVTGASRGIGRACALGAGAGRGARGAGGAQPRKLEEVADEIRQRGGEAFVVEIDLASADSIRRPSPSRSAEFGRIDILVNNAGITKDGLALRMKPEDWDIGARRRI